MAMLKIYILTFRDSTTLKIQMCKSCKQKISCVRERVTAWWAPRRCHCSYHSSPAGGSTEHTVKREEIISYLASESGFFGPF